jgi:hypothetical protein
LKEPGQPEDLAAAAIRLWSVIDIVKLLGAMGNKENWIMAKQNEEEIFEKYLEAEFNSGSLGAISKMKMLEDFRSARAQRKHARDAAIAAAVSAVCAAASVAISLLALFSR